MKNLKTNYMKTELDNPIIIGASDLITSIDMLKKAEENGAGAIIYKSLFEEQIQLEKYQFDEKLSEFNDIHPEMLTTHPNVEHAGPREHLVNVRQACESLSIPVFASLNAINPETWVEYATLLSETGIDGIELNFYSIPKDSERDAKQIEDEQIEIVKTIKQKLSIPVSVKLSTGYTNILNFADKLDRAGADSLVLFNSFYQPDIDINEEKHIKSSNLSREGDYKESLRFTGLLYNNIAADICSSRGIFTGEDVVKMLLAGASCVQVVSTLYKNDLTQIGEIKKKLSEWMDMKGYDTIDMFRGKLSKSKINNPFVYKRAQYVDLLINSEELFPG